MTRPAVPPYSSRTMAMWTLRRWNSWSRSSIDIDSGTKTGVRRSDRIVGRRLAVGPQDGQQVLGVEDPDDLVDRGPRRPGSGVALARRPGRSPPRGWRRPGSATMSMRGTITSWTRLFAELDDRADHLLLLGLEDALLAAALDEQLELLGGHRLGAHLARAEEPGDGAGDRREQDQTIGPRRLIRNSIGAGEEEGRPLGVGQRRATWARARRRRS